MTVYLCCQHAVCVCTICNFCFCCIEKYLVFLHGVFEVIVYAGDEMAVKPSQGKEDRSGGRGSKWIHVPGKLGTHPECLVEETVSL